MVLSSVMMMTMILFMLVTSLLVLQNYYTVMTQSRGNRMSATHIADAGLNDYLYQVKKNSSYYLTVPDTGWVSFGGGKYRVTATPPVDGKPLTLHAEGSSGATVTIAATVRYPTFADYIFLSNGDIWFGAGAQVNGQVRSNGAVRNDGHITSKTYAGTTISGSGTFYQGKYAPYATVDFGQIAVKMDDIMTAAKAHSPSSYFPKTPAGSYGYRVTFNGSSYGVDRVTGGTTTGNLTVVVLGSYVIPIDGAIYFDDTVWVQGSYGANVTIAGSSDIYIMNSYQRSNPSARYTAGLIAKSNIIIPSWYPSVPQNMVVNAAVMAKSGKFYADMKSGIFRSTLTLLGAATYADATGGFVTVDGYGHDIAGFHSRSYNYDGALDFNPPPFYPAIADGSLKVATWIEEGGVQ
jgi:hypothetical protein